MGEEGKKNAGKDGVVIKKNSASAAEKKDENREELTIDSLDGGSRGASETSVKKRTDIHTEEGTETGRKNENVERLNEDEITELLSAKNDLEESKRLIEEKDRLISEYEDLLKRKQAEFENFRKRALRDIEENKKYANAEMVLDVITIMDNFDRAVEAAAAAKDFDGLLEGIIMIERQFRDMLEKKYGVQKIEAVGKEFDPNLHDAIMMEESSEYEEDTVVEDFQKGYIMYDRLIRPSKVKVAKAGSSADQPNTINGNEEEESGETD
jgi:molecular chaperone GrpE